MRLEVQPPLPNSTCGAKPHGNPHEDRLFKRHCHTAAPQPGYMRAWEEGLRQPGRRRGGRFGAW